MEHLNNCMHLFLDIPVQQKEMPLHRTRGCADFLTASLLCLLLPL